MLKIYCEDISLLDNDEVYNEMLSNTSGYRQKRVNALKSYDSKKACIICEHLLKLGLKDVKGFYPKVNYVFNVHGKPYLRPYKDVFFNFSHSGTKVVCVISDDEVGIDIQKIQSVKENFLKKYFTENERHLIKINDGNVDSDSFTRLWTYKESYIKYKGLGLSMPLNSFDVMDLSKSGECKFTDVLVGAGYKCTVCSKNI